MIWSSVRTIARADQLFALLRVGDPLGARRDVARALTVDLGDSRPLEGGQLVFEDLEGLHVDGVAHPPEPPEAGVGGCGRVLGTS